MKRLELLDYARLVSAMCVLGLHYLSEAILNGTLHSLAIEPGIASIAKYGYLGVEMFFLISGYVIFFSAKGRTAGEFAAARALRLYPAFWFCVLLSALVLFLGGEQVGVRQVLLNLTMVPKLFNVAPVDGAYWTLLHEAAFYTIVWIALAIGLRKHLESVFVGWAFLMVVAWSAGRGGMPIFGAYYPFFVAGALFAMLRDKVSPVRLVCVFALLVLCVHGSVLRSFDAALGRGIPYSHAVIAAVIICQFAFFAVLNHPRALKLRLPGSRIAGALTYPVYLIHTSIGVVLLNHFGSESWKWESYLAVTAVIIMAAYAVHAVVERKLAPFWSWLFEWALRKPIDWATYRVYRSLNRTTIRVPGPRT